MQPTDEDIDEMAFEKRRLMDGDETNWEEATIEAILKIAEERRSKILDATYALYVSAAAEQGESPLDIKKFESKLFRKVGIIESLIKDKPAYQSWLVYCHKKRK